MGNKLKTLYWINFLEGCYFHGPIVSLFLTSNAISVGALFLSQVFYAAGTLLCEVPFGVLADRYGHEKSIRLGYLLDAMCLVLLIIFPTTHMLYILYFMRGAASAFSSGSLETVLYRIDQKKYTKNLSIAGQFAEIGNLFSVLMATLLFGWFGDISFEVLIGMSVCAQASGFFLTFGLPPSRSSKDIETGVNEWQILKSSFELLRSNTMIRQLLVWSLLVVGGGYILEAAAPLIMREIGVWDFMIPAVFVLSSVLSIGFLRLVTRFEKSSLRLVSIVRSVLFATCGAVFVFSTSPVIAYAAFLIMFSVRDVLGPLYLKKISDLATDHNRATVLSLFSVYKYFVLIVLRISAGILGTADNSILLLSGYALVGVCVFVWSGWGARSNRKVVVSEN